MKLPKMPYFDFLFEKFERGDQQFITAYGKHVHWGYWPDPKNVSTTPESYAQAQDALSRLVFEGAQVRNGMKVLDVGCGFGGTIDLINEAYSDVHLSGLNIDARQLDRARGWVKAKPSNSVEFVEGDACQLPFGDDAFDALTAVECIFHFPSRLRFLKEAHRVMKPGSWLSISDFVPSGIFLPILAVGALFVQRHLSKVYGDSDAVVTPTIYKVIWRMAGFRRIEFQDITRETLPTFPALQGLYSESDFGDIQLKRANRPIETASRLGMLKYMIIRFQK